MNPQSYEPPSHHFKSIGTSKLKKHHSICSRRSRTLEKLLMNYRARQDTWRLLFLMPFDQHSRDFRMSCFSDHNWQMLSRRGVDWCFSQRDDIARNQRTREPKKKTPLFLWCWGWEVELWGNLHDFPAFGTDLVCWLRRPWHIWGFFFRPATADPFVKQ